MYRVEVYVNRTQERIVIGKARTVGGVFEVYQDWCIDGDPNPNPNYRAILNGIDGRHAELASDFVLERVNRRTGDRDAWFPWPFGCSPYRWMRRLA